MNYCEEIIKKKRKGEDEGEMRPYVRATCLLMCEERLLFPLPFLFLLLPLAPLSFVSFPPLVWPFRAQFFSPSRENGNERNL